MPKKSLVLNGFGGGLNIDSDSTDITSEGRDDDELTISDNILNDFKGKSNVLLPEDLAGGISAGTSPAVVNTKDELLIYNNEYFQQEGLYKHGNQVVCSGSITVTKPNAGTLGHTTELSGIINLSAVASTDEDLIVFMGTGAQAYGGTQAYLDTAGAGAIFGMDSGVPQFHSWGVTFDTAFKDQGNNLSTDTPLNGLIEAVRCYAKGSTADLYNDWENYTFMGDIGMVGEDSSVFRGYTVEYQSTAGWTPSVISANTLNNSNLATGTTTINVNSLRIRGDTQSANGVKDHVWVIFRTGPLIEDSGEDDGIDEISPLFPGGAPGISGKNPTIEIAFDLSPTEWGYVEYLALAFDSDARNTDCHWAVDGGDEYARIYKLTRAELETYGISDANNSAVRITLPESSVANQGPSFDANDIQTMWVGIKFTDGNKPSSSSIFFQLFELSFTSTELSSWSNNDYIFWQTKLTDDTEKSERVESLPVQYGGGVFNTDSVTGLGLTFRVTRPDHASVHNGRIYWQLADKNSNGIGERFLLCTVDKDGDAEDVAIGDNTGVLPAGQTAWLPWRTDEPKWYVAFTMANRPENSTYQLESGYPDDTEYINANWKTAAVVGRQVYIGNVEQPTGGGYDASKILKSAVGKYYGFPNSQYIDLEFGGDAIKVLKAVGDRLFVFSTDKLTIINVAQDFEILEGQFENMGVTYHKQVCKVSEGIAWVNAQGVHYFNGTKVETLSDEKMLSESWSVNSIIGYFPARKMLLVWVDADDNGECEKIHCYSFKSNSWAGTLTSGTILTTQPGTNVVTGNDGITYYIGKDDNAIKKIVEDANLTPTITLQTGRIGMGDLSRNKKFTKIYVVGTSLSGNETLYYGVDGGAATNSLGALSSGTGENAVTLSGVSGKDIQLKITGASTAASEINDIKIIYREKTLK